MNKVIAGSVVAVLCHVGIASAGVPAWCKDASFEAKYELKDLSSQDIRDVVSTLVMATCKPTGEASAAAAQIETARQAWGKKMFMSDADWADAVAYVNEGGRPNDLELSVKDLTLMTPVDQYFILSESARGNSHDTTDYYTDMFEPNLTEVGRFAFVDACLDYSPSPVDYAQCQGDIDALDKAKFAVQLRGDTAHPGANKMRIRLYLYSLPKRLKEHADKVAKILATDASYKKLWEAAAKGRAQFASAITDKSLLALATKMDSAVMFKSRKQFDGCEGPAQAAFEKVVKENVPASLFKDIPRDDALDQTVYVATPDYSKTFGTLAAAQMATVPQLLFVSAIYNECDKTDKDTQNYLQRLFTYSAGFRGPRRAALDAMRREKIVLDDMNETIQFPGTGGQLFVTRDAGGSDGGVVNTVTEDGDKLVISFAANTKKEQDCIKSHYTKKVTGYSNGKPNYELICDKYGLVNVDHSASDRTVDKKFKPLLKKGAQFSSWEGLVIAVWPSKKAAVPSSILGVEVK
ncbi:hypothetical protein BH11MYX2_BH11MYX2_04210 [soil metagenome]